MNAIDAAADPRRAEAAEKPDHVAIRAFGFWMYLMTDLVLFATLFTVFAVMRHSYAAGPDGKSLFDLSHTFIETMMLLLSSTTYGYVMVAVHQDRRRWVLAGLVMTFVLGLLFIYMEVREFHGMLDEGHSPQRSAFLSAYFTLVGTHGTHVSLGLVWMAVMMLQVAVKGLTMPVKSRLLRLSLFWHFLDIVWIFIFTFVYLMESL